MRLVVFGFLKCPLIGCTVTVSCFICPLWHLNVAYLTSKLWGETSYLAARTVNLSVQSNSTFTSFFFASVSAFNVSFQGVLFFTGEHIEPPKSKIHMVSTPFHNHYLVSVCVNVCQHQSGTSVNMVTFLPPQVHSKASD